MRKNKGQGALEYLLLIGGAVLIAVIVIALLVGMGGQSRESAQDQATKAQKATDVPQPASIANVDAIECDDQDDGTINLDWTPLASGGIYTLYVYDYQENSLIVNVDTTSTLSAELDPSDLSPDGIDVNISNNDCQNTYWVEIETNKNGQKVKSTRYSFNW